MNCCNCGRTENVQSYSFDMDLPTITACQVCIFAISAGDDELLAAMRPRRKRRKAEPKST